MIKNDLLQFISSNNIRNGLSNKAKKGGGEKQGSFEDVLNAKNKLSSHENPYKKESTKFAFGNNKALDAREPSRKDNSTLEQNSKNKDASCSQTESNKKVEESKPIANENKDSEQNTAKEDINIDNLYGGLASTLIGSESKDNNTVQVDSDLKPNVQNDTNGLILDLDFNEDSLKAVDIISISGENTILTDENELSNDFGLNLEKELKQPSNSNNQKSMYLESEAEENEKGIVVELTNSLKAEGQEIITKDPINEQDTKLLLKSFFEEDVENIHKDNKEKIIGDKNHILSDEETIIQNNDLKQNSILANYNDNNQSSMEQSIENTFEALITKEKPVILDKESIFEQIVEKAKIDIGKTDEIKIKLKPDFLGEISLKISNEKGIVTVKAYVENYNVKQLIESNLDNLRDNMKELGLNFEALDVSVGKDSGFQKNDSQSWKQEQRIKVRKTKLESISMFSNYEEEIGALAGGLYSINGNLDLIV